MDELRLGWRGRGRLAVLSLLVVLAVLLPIGGYAPVGPVAPGLESVAAQSYPGWMTPEQAARFANDWPALVPSYVPEPFAGVVPSISIDGTSYRIYWYVGGGAPTFLDVRGYLNGYIPAGSAYDLNVELTVNSTVRGNAAYHDPTPIYDAVYWREGGISYWANSQGLSTDIVSYADGFTSASAPASEPTATVVAPATLYSPDAVVSGGSGTVTASGGGTAGTLTADGGYFPDTGTASYPGAGDAAVAWVAPDVTVDTVVTFSLLDAGGAVLVTTPTLVTAVEVPVALSVACAPSVGVGQPLPVSVTGAGSVMLDASAGSWPRTSPNTDYDPGTDGTALAFSLGEGSTAVLTWSAPAIAQTATIRVYGTSGMVVGSCRVEVVGDTSTGEPTGAVVTATITATLPVAGEATVRPTASVGAGQPVASATVPGTDPTDGTDPGSDPPSTVPGTGTGDGIDSGDGPAPSPTVRPGDGTDFGGAATVPPGATYPSVPTSAPLPDAPPTSVPPASGAPTAPTTGATAGPTRSAPTTASTAPPATVVGTTPPDSRPPATETRVPPTATATLTTVPVPPTATPPPPATSPPASPVPTQIPPTATSAVTEAALAVQATPPPTATATPPTPTSTAVPPTPVPPTATSVPPIPTASPVPPTVTAVPPTATAVPPTPTVVPPTATATRRPQATATVTPVRSDPGSRVGGALPAYPTATIGPTNGPTVAPASPVVSTPLATPTLSPAAEAVTQEIGPDGGTVRHPAGAELHIGPGVFDSTMTVSIAQVSDADLPVSPDVDLVPSSGYDIEITGSDGRVVTTLPAGVVLRLNVPVNVRDDAVVFWVDDGELSQLGVTNQEAAGISAPLAHLSRYVAGVPLDEKPELGWLPWAVAIAAAISGLLIVGLLATHTRRQRRRGTGWAS